MARRYKHGLARAQKALLPPRVEDDVSETSLVRAIDTYVDTLDLEALDFTSTGGGGSLRVSRRSVRRCY